MTRIKLCGLSRLCDIKAANELMSEYVGFVFVEKSRRYVSPGQAVKLKEQLSKDIKSVGVFVNAEQEFIVDLLGSGIIDIVQLHGGESEEYINQLRHLTDKPIIKAFSVDGKQDIERANASSADYVLLDSGKGGTGTVFDWNLIQKMKRPYFLAGGLAVSNVGNAVKKLKPYAVDVSSGIETDGYKDRNKMKMFVKAVRNSPEITCEECTG